MKQWIRPAMVMLVGLLLFGLSMPGVALSAETDLPIPIPQNGYQPINCARENVELPIPPRESQYQIEFPTSNKMPSACDPLQPRIVELDDATVYGDMTYTTL